MPDEQPVLPGRIARYRILNRLGSGGMGDVYAGLDETLQRRVALKAIQADRRLSAESQERFLREARILSQLDHPNICRAYDYIKGDDSDWLVMELIDGWSLGDVLKKHPMGPEAIKIAEQVAAVLVVTHSAGIVHRDLKPGNVMITPTGDAKVLDFGIARSGDPNADVSPDAARAAAISMAANSAVDVDVTRASDVFSTSTDPDETRFHTRLDAAIGTLPYMSPEQARGETATSASDMFSFGLLLQEMLTGRRAYPGGRDAAALIERVQNGRTETLTGSGDLEKLVRRLTSLAPSQRPTAVETVERLQWIRNTPKRRLRRLAISAALVVTVLASLKYTFDLRRERTAAVMAEADANRRRGQAEALIGFMLGDLRSKLEKAGRLDLLEAVGGQAMTYFGSVPASTLTGEELSRRAQALYQIGAVRQQQGNLKDARAAYDESLAVATQVVARDPSNADWQLRLATAHFYAGDVRRRENDLTGAMKEFAAYRDIAAALVKRDPNNLTWALELSYGYGGVAAVQELQGDLDGARKGLELALAIKERLAAAEPKKMALRPDLAVAHNRLGVVLDKLGDMDSALTHYNADLEIRKALVASDPNDQSIKRLLYTAMYFVGVAHEERGDLTGAMAQYQAAYDLMAPLAASDAKNANWQRDLAVADRFIGDLQSMTGHASDARARFQRAEAVLGPIAAAATTDVTRQRDLAQVEIGLGLVELNRGNVAAARADAADIERLLAALYQKKPDEATGRALAVGRLLAADVAERAGDAKNAQLFRESALTIARGIAGTHGKRVLATEARALLALGRMSDARPIVTDLWRLGYRHPLLIQAWRAKGGEVLDSRLPPKSR